MVRRGVLLLGVSVLVARASFGQSNTDVPEYDPFGGCADLYYGVGVPQSFAKAYACFQEAGDNIWLILLTLNGEGTPRSVTKARALLTHARQRDTTSQTGSEPGSQCCESGSLEVAEQVVGEREADPKRLSQRVHICDFALGTNGIEVCAADFASVLEARDDAELKRLGATLPASAGASLKRLITRFEEFRRADGAWMYAEYVAGTGRGTFAHFEEMYDQSNFMSLISKVVKHHRLRAPTEQEWQARSAELDSAYRDAVQGVIADQDSMLKDSAFKDNWATIRMEKESYLEAAKETRGRWIKLQQAWEALCEQLYRGEMPSAAIDRAIIVALGEARIRELAGTALESDKYDPFHAQTP